MHAANADSGKSSLLRAAVVLLLVVLADQATKLWAISALQLREPVEILGTFLQFTLVYNRGGAMGTSFGSPTYYLVASLLILTFVIYYLYLNRGIPHVVYPLALIAGGAIGNIIDRIRLGMVIDFIDVDFFDISLFGFALNRWWTFNIADAAISVSIVFLIVSLFLHRQEHAEHLPQVASDRSPDDRAETL